MLPLEGVRVVEFAHMVMGPSCGLALADLGAEVIKVEPLAGDNTRRLEAAGAGFFPVFNRNKKSFAVDLAQPEGKTLVGKLLDTADVLTENFRPGALDKLGFSYADMEREGMPRESERPRRRASSAFGPPRMGIRTWSNFLGIEPQATTILHGARFNTS